MCLTIIMTYKQWKEYFIANKRHFAWLDLSDAAKLDRAEVDTISDSIKQFQKGENSEGKNLIEYAKTYENDDYLEAIQNFIREEQRHAEVLGRFMTLNEITRLRSHWIDDIFRKLRSLSGLENSIIVLLTAEIIAAVYYKALRDTTRSHELVAICERILIDEEMHINFQSFTLKNHFQKKSLVAQKAARVVHRILMLGTTIVVWHAHKKVLRAGKYSYSTFHREVFEEFKRSEQMITGRSEVICKVTPPRS